MASMDSLSNSEIRSKLAEFGAPVGPVTDTTRKVLLKKLKHLSVQRNSSAKESSSNKSRKSLSRFSSGEDDSEDDHKNANSSSKMPPPNANYRNTRRQTVGSPRVSESASPANKSRRSVQVTPTSPKPLIEESEKRSGRFSSVGLSTPQPSSGVTSPTNNVTTRRGSQRSNSSPAEEYDDGSDSDTPVSKIISGLRKGRDLKTVLVDTTENSSNLINSSGFLSRLSSARSPYLSDLNGGDQNAVGATSEDDLLAFRKRYSSAKDASPQLPDSSSPYQSNFARRLSMARDRKPGSSMIDTSTRTLDLLKFRNSDGNYAGNTISSSNSTSLSRENGHYPSNRPEPSTSFASDRGRDLSQEFKTTEDVAVFWKNSQIMSMILLAFVFMFFLILGLTYVNVRWKDSTNFFSEHERNNFPLCTSGDDSIKPCIQSSDLSSAIEVMRELHPRLVERSIVAQCGPPLHDGSYVNAEMSENEAVKILKERMNFPNVMEAKKSLHNLKLILLKNPHWGVTITGPFQAAKGLEQVEDVSVLIEHGGMVVNNAVVPFKCWVKQIVSLAITSLVVVGIGFAVMFVGQKGVTWFLHKREKEKQEVYFLVQRIIELLQSHHHNLGSPGGGAAGQSFLAINHVRDQLIPPQDRKSMAGLWAKAVTFLEHNESRVRHEVQHVAGEECPVWRWLPVSFANPSAGGSPVVQHSPLPNSILEPFNPNRNKVWQGQAFETDAGSPNSLPCSPTPCLKLRHMFDLDSEYGDDWPVKVQDAILEKCDGVKVLHIAVDKTSNEGCVYVKCTSQEEAGRAYRALHGWWFDSKLVTVKYIRLERYHERFPDAKNARVPLKPSNNKKLSLQANFWQSPLEAN